MILCWLQAMMANHSHSHDHAPSRKDSEPDDHDVNIWRGLVAMLGVVFFYFTEKCLTLIAECRKKRQRKTQVRSYCRVVQSSTDCNSVKNIIIYPNERQLCILYLNKLYTQIRKKTGICKCYYQKEVWSTGNSFQYCTVIPLLQQSD